MNPNGEIVRLAPEEPLPSYSYVPGQFPHPTSDPAGHSYGVQAHTPVELDPQAWRQIKPYLFGIDLFNYRYYWESHVEFESLWLACGRRGTSADFLKGLIKLAAAGVKHLQGQPEGVRSHSCRAAELWRQTAAALGAEQEVYLGMRIQELIDVAEAICRTGWPHMPPLLIPAGK